MNKNYKRTTRGQFEQNFYSTEQRTVGFISKSKNVYKKKFESSGEEEISRILKQKGIKFYREYSFKDLVNIKTNKPLRFDFYIIDYNTVIEFDGLQHKLKMSGQTGRDLKDQKQRDKLKNEYCKKNKIKILRFNRSTVKDFERLFDKFVIGNTSYNH